MFDYLLGPLVHPLANVLRPRDQCPPVVSQLLVLRERVRGGVQGGVLVQKAAELVPYVLEKEGKRKGNNISKVL